MSKVTPVDRPKASQPQTILLVEDDPFIKLLLSKDLQERGYKVLQANNSKEALQLCKQHAGPIHLLLTDLLLPPNRMQMATSAVRQPSMHGVELMRCVVASRPDIRVILMSGHSDEELKAMQVFREGKPFLRKPINLDVLLRTVHEVLSKPAQI